MIGSFMSKATTTLGPFCQPADALSATRCTAALACAMASGEKRGRIASWMAVRLKAGEASARSGNRLARFCTR